MPDPNGWCPNPGPLEFEEAEIHVWRAYLDRTETILHQFEATLSADEKIRADRFVFQRDRNHFVGTRGILRELLAGYLRRSPEDLQFDYSALGKPSLRGEIFRHSVQFNVSHSHGLALLAFTVGRNLGVDIEFVRSGFASEEIADHYFSTQEVAELRTLPPSLQEEGFFLCWTRKEAYVKARGEGLHIPLGSFRVSLTPGQPEILESPDSCRWRMWSLHPDPQYVGALVVEGQNLRLRQWGWKPQDSM
jgi:4'-phosphopantetheinyl transferase